MNLYPLRPSLARYILDTNDERLVELLTATEPFVVRERTSTRCWVATPAELFDLLVVCWSGINETIERRRQELEPLPPL